MNSYKYKPSTVLFDERVKNTLSKMQEEYSNGPTKTKTQYAYALKEAVFGFYRDMGKPTYRFIAASDVPSFLHYKSMVKSAVTDMGEITSGCEQLNTVLQEMNTVMQEEVMFMNNTITSIENQIVGIENKIHSLSNASSMIYTDAFTSKERNTDGHYSSSKVIADVTDGACRLQKMDSYIEKNFEVEIMDTSNGFPGNTHEIYDTMSGIKYVGDIDPRISIANVLTSDRNSWFEFEMYNVDSDTRLKTSSIGFRYKEGIEWVTDEKELRLNLKITLKNPRKLNTLKIGGIAKLNYYTDNPVITEIIITDDYACTQSINYGGELKEDTMINFKPQVVKEIVIKIVQNDSILTNVARTYAISVDASKTPYFSSDNYSEYTKVDEPMVSIDALGLKYNSKNKKIIYPSTSSNNSFLSSEFIKSNLFYSNINTESDKKIFTEKINAYRYHIGVSYIMLEYNEYTTDNVYISELFESPVNIKKITLNALDNVPNSFIELKDENKAYKKPYISYYVGFNEEEEWHEIHPRSSYTRGPCSLIINSYNNVESRSSNIKYIDRLIDATSVRLKIELNRPDEICDETPVVLQYSLDIDGEE